MSVRRYRLTVFIWFKTHIWILNSCLLNFDLFYLSISTGLVTGICEPVHHANHLVGVACVDVRIADILRDIAYYQHGEFAYSFVIDGTGGFRWCFPLPRLYILTIITSLAKGGYVCGRISLPVCLSVCLFVGNITQKVMNELQWNFVDESWEGHWRTD